MPRPRSRRLSPPTPTEHVPRFIDGRTPARMKAIRRSLAKKFAMAKRSRELTQQKAPGLSTGGFARPDEPAWDDHGAYAVDQD